MPLGLASGEATHGTWSGQRMPPYAGSIPAVARGRRPTRPSGCRTRVTLRLGDDVFAHRSFWMSGRVSSGHGARHCFARRRRYLFASVEACHASLLQRAQAKRKAGTHADTSPRAIGAGSCNSVCLLQGYLLREVDSAVALFFGAKLRQAVGALHCLRSPIRVVGLQRRVLVLQLHTCNAFIYDGRRHSSLIQPLSDMARKRGDAQRSGPSDCREEPGTEPFEGLGSPLHGW